MTVNACESAWQSLTAAACHAQTEPVAAYMRICFMLELQVCLQTVRYPFKHFHLLVICRAHGGMHAPTLQLQCL